ncbi:MAG: hypothetical protein ABSB74_11370 [Tepidisphaeraceae bacterium]
MMRRTPFIIAGLALMTAAWPARAQDAPATTEPAATAPAATMPSAQISSLITQLDSPDFSVRQAAENKLIDLGPDIEPMLRSALAGKLSDEARARLNDVTGRLEESNLLHAMVTMHYKDAPLQTVLNEFAWQAGADLEVRQPAVTGYAQGRTASIDLDRADFWLALRAVSDASGLRPWVGPLGLTLAPSGQRAFVQIDLANRYAREAGGLLIAPRTCQEFRILNYAANQPVAPATLNLIIDVIPEPKLHVIGVTNMDWLKECVDDKGHSLMPAVMNQRFFRPMARRREWWWPLQVTLRPTPQLGMKIARLRGRLDFTAQTRSQIVEVNDITRARNVTKNVGDLSLTVQSCQKTNLNCQLGLTLQGVALGDPVLQDFLSSAELVDDDGQTVRRQSFSTTPAADGVVINIVFLPSMTTPSKLRWERTLEQKKLSVPFELDDLPLPMGP